MISVVGIAAMIWVGGHILLVGTNDLGWHAPYDLVHHLEVAAHDSVEVVGAVLGWLVNTAASALVGLLVGAVVVTRGAAAAVRAQEASLRTRRPPTSPERDLSPT